MKYNNKQKHTFPFFMISTCFPQIIYKMIKEDPMAILVFFALMDCSNNNGAIIISEKDLHKDLHVSLTSISQAIKYLNNNNYIKILEHKGHNVYIINSNIFWHTYSYVRKQLTKDMNFMPAAKLTQINNRKYYKYHHDLKINNNTPNHADLIRNYISQYHKSLHHKKEISKINSKDKRHAKYNIKRQIRKHNKWTPKEVNIIHYLLQHIPLDAKSPGFKITNKELCHPTKSSYVTVAKATLKLKHLDIIIHKHGYIKYNPRLLPMEKAYTSNNKPTFNKKDKIINDIFSNKNK